MAQQILPKLFLPDDVADLCEFLLGPQSQSLSGQVLKVGGALMNLIEKLSLKWENADYPFLIHPSGDLRFAEVSAQEPIDLSEVRTGDVVALIGDFDPPSILTLLRLIDLGVILVPLTVETREDHAYFFESAQVDVVIENGKANRRSHSQIHPLIEELRKRGNAGLVLFSTGTTGRPKAILHDFSSFSNGSTRPGQPYARLTSFSSITSAGSTPFCTPSSTEAWWSPLRIDRWKASRNLYGTRGPVLPTTPTFPRMMLMSGLVPDQVPSSWRIITYGTERMDQPTLDQLCELLPEVDFRQTFRECPSLASFGSNPNPGKASS